MQMMIKHRNMRASSDDESDASCTQRQAIGGAPQTRSGVERDNLRNDGGATMVDRSSDKQTQPSTSQRLQQMWK